MFAEGIFPIGDGLLDINEEKLKELLVPDDINEIYELEQTPFARGKFAAVRRAIHKNSGVHFAAKFLKRRRRAQSSDKEIKHEIAVLKLCDGAENIVKLNAVHESRSDTALLLELATGGELQTFLDNEECLSEAHARYCMREVLKALQFLHKRSIAHLDLKPQNILLTGERIEDGLKLCDFGISRVVAEGTNVREIVGTPDYVAPEVLQYEPLSLLTDIWSVGVLAYVLLSGFSPFGGDTKQETFLNISQCALTFPDKLFGGVSAAAIDFIRRSLRIKPNDRMSATGCLEHIWLKDECSIDRQICTATNDNTANTVANGDNEDEDDIEDDDEEVEEEPLVHENEMSLVEEEKEKDNNVKREAADDDKVEDENAMSHDDAEDENEGENEDDEHENSIIEAEQINGTTTTTTTNGCNKMESSDTEEPVKVEYAMEERQQVELSEHEDEEVVLAANGKGGIQNKINGQQHNNSSRNNRIGGNSNGYTNYNGRHNGSYNNNAGGGYAAGGKYMNGSTKSSAKSTAATQRTTTTTTTVTVPAMRATTVPLQYKKVGGIQHHQQQQHQQPHKQLQQQQQQHLPVRRHSSSSDSNKENTFLATKKILPTTATTIASHNGTNLIKKPLNATVTAATMATMILIDGNEMMSCGHDDSASTFTLPCDSSFNGHGNSKSVYSGNCGSPSTAATTTTTTHCLFPDAPTTPKVIRKAPNAEASPTSVKALVKKFQLEGGQTSPNGMEKQATTATTTATTHLKEAQTANQQQINGSTANSTQINGGGAQHEGRSGSGHGSSSKKATPVSNGVVNKKYGSDHRSSSSTSSSNGRRASEPTSTNVTHVSVTHNRTGSGGGGANTANFKSTCVVCLSCGSKTTTTATSVGISNSHGCRHSMDVIVTGGGKHNKTGKNNHNSQLKGAFSSSHHKSNGGGTAVVNGSSSSSSSTTATTSAQQHSHPHSHHQHTHPHSHPHPHAHHPHTGAHHHLHTAAAVAKSVAANNLSLDQGIIC